MKRARAFAFSIRAAICSALRSASSSFPRTRRPPCLLVGDVAEAARASARASTIPARREISSQAAARILP